MNGTLHHSSLGKLETHFLPSNQTIDYSRALCPMLSMPYLDVPRAPSQANLGHDAAHAQVRASSVKKPMSKAHAIHSTARYYGA